MERIADALAAWRKAVRRLDRATNRRRRAERAAASADRARIARVAELEAAAKAAEIEAHERFLSARADAERRIRESGEQSILG